MYHACVNVSTSLLEVIPCIMVHCKYTVPTILYRAVKPVVETFHQFRCFTLFLHVKRESHPSYSDFSSLGTFSWPKIKDCTSKANYHTKAYSVLVVQWSVLY